MNDKRHFSCQVLPLSLAIRWLTRLKGEQSQDQVALLQKHSRERCLILEWTGQEAGAPLFAGDLQAVEPFLPGRGKGSFDPDAIA
jgi:hypothetical protein